MPSTPIDLNVAIPLSLTLFDGATGKFPQAHIFDSADAEVAGSPFSLTEADAGRYTLSGFTPTVDDTYTVKYIVYNDSGHTSESATHGRAEETIVINVLDKIQEGTKTVRQGLRAIGATTAGKNKPGFPNTFIGLDETTERVTAAVKGKTGERLDVDYDLD